MTYPNTVISMPSNLFTLNDKFKACTNGSVYVGQVDTDPTVEANQIQAYIEQENGTLVPVVQPIKINAAGILVDSNGQVQKFVLTNDEYSMAVLNSQGVQEFYFSRIYDQGIAAALEVEERSLGPGASLYRGSNGKYVQDGDTVPAGTTHLTVLINGKPENVAIFPSVSGLVSSLTESSVTIGIVPVEFSTTFKANFKTVGDMLSANTIVGGRYTTGSTDWERLTLSNPSILSDFKALGRVNLGDLGAKFDDDTDDSAIWAQALSIARVIELPEGRSINTLNLTIPTGTIIYGQGRQTYGEFDQNSIASTMVWRGTGYAIESDEFSKAINFQDWCIEGDYTNDGYKIGNTSREHTYTRFAIKYVLDGLYSDDGFVITFKDCTVTAQGTAVDWGGGTTCVFDIGIQGDPRVGDCQVGYNFRGGLANSKVRGFIQYCTDYINIAGRNDIILDCLDNEYAAITGSWINLGDITGGSLTIVNCNAVLGTALDDIAIINIVGTVSSSFMVDIQSVYHHLPKAGYWIRGNLTFPIHMKESYLSAYQSKLDSSIDINFIKVVGADSASQTKAIYITNPTTSPTTYNLDMLVDLYKGTFKDRDGNYLRGGIGSISFANGITFKISTAYPSGTTIGQPMASYFSVRWASGGYHTITPIVKTSENEEVPITIDEVAGTFTLTSGTASQVFIITIG